MFINIYDKNKQLLNIQYKILIDQTLEEIKNIIFVENSSWYPGFIKLTYNDTILTNMDNIFLFNLTDTDIKQTYDIIAYNLLDEITNEKLLELFYQLTDNLEFQHQEYIEAGYIDLELDDMLSVLKLLIYNKIDNKLIDPDEFKSLGLKISETFNTVVSKITNNPIYELYKNFKIPEFMPTINIQQLDLYISSTFTDKFIKLDKLFNLLSLSDTIPVIALNSNFIGKKNQAPLIKIKDDLKSKLDDKQIRNWFLNEKYKSQQVSYKKIKGISIKSFIQEFNQYANINLTENGHIYYRIALDSENDYTLDNLKTIILENINNIIGIINKLDVFKFSKKIQKITIENIQITDFTASLKLNYFVSKTKLNRILMQNFISENLFELKNTSSTDLVSFYYKKSGKKLNVVDIDRKGITVNIKDNPYELNSSLLHILTGYNIHQIYLIYYQLYNILELTPSQNTDDIFDESEDEEQVLKEKSHIKELRKEGINIISTNCQKPRQPLINENVVLNNDSYTLEFKGNKYVCPNPKYPYPGFTNENIVCCFKKDQRRREAYIRNTSVKDLDIMVQVSNLRIYIIYKDKRLETYPIKIVSDYIDGLNPSNSMGRYYFINESKELIEIKNTQVREKLDNMYVDIWLEPVPFNQIINTPPKNKCNYIPNMNEFDIHEMDKVCQHYPKNNFFGYNMNSFPCCFDKMREIQVKKKEKEKDLTKQHILTTDKILDNDRLGALPEYIKTLLPNWIRLGVIQNNNNFINCMLKAFKLDKMSANEFKLMLINYLKDNKLVISKIPNVLNHFKTIDKYISYIQTETKLDYNYLIDLISLVTKTNILILNTPLVKKEQTRIGQYTFDYKMTTINCSNLTNWDNYVIIYKRGAVYELIVELNETKLISIFDRHNEYITRLLEFRKHSCVKIIKKPDLFNFDILLKSTEIDPKLIRAQILSLHNKINYILTVDNFLIPIEERELIDNLSIVNFDEIIKWNKLKSYNEYFNLKIKLNSGESVPIVIKGVTVRPGTQLVDSILTNFGMHIPTRPIILQDNIEILKYNYYPYIHESESNVVNEFNTNIKNYKQLIYQIKLFYGQFFEKHPEQASIIKEHVKQFDSRINQFNHIKQILINIAKSLEFYKSEYDFIIDIITNDILLDTIEFSILTNNIVNEYLDIEQKDGETLLLNAIDFINWSKT